MNNAIEKCTFEFLIYSYEENRHIHFTVSRKSISTVLLESEKNVITCQYMYGIYLETKNQTHNIKYLEIRTT